MLSTTIKKRIKLPQLQKKGFVCIFNYKGIKYSSHLKAMSTSVTSVIIFHIHQREITSTQVNDTIYYTSEEIPAAQGQCATERLDKFPSGRADNNSITLFSTDIQQ